MTFSVSPKVSVLMPAFNAAGYIRESIESVLKQQYPAFELVILDDGSSDGTWDIITGYSDEPRLGFFRQKNKGEAMARNRLLRLARGEYVVFHDADDIMLPGRLRKQVSFLERHRSLGGVFGDTLVFDSNENPPLGFLPMTKEAQCGRSFFPPTSHCAFMFRKRNLLRIGGYDPRYKIGVDEEMLMRLAEKTELRYLKGPAFLYRVNGASLVSRTSWSRDEIQHRLIRSVLARRNGGVNTAAVRIFNRSILVRSNSKVISEALRTVLYPDALPPRGKHSFEFELYEVPHLDGIYRHVPFDTRGMGGDFSYTERGSIAYWRSEKHLFVASMNRRTGKVFLCMEKPSRLDPDALVELAILYPMLYLTQPLGWRFVHAAAAVRDSGAVLIAGHSGAGKSTLSLALAERGWKILSDETSILVRKRGGFEVRGFPRMVQVKKSAFSIFPRLEGIRRELKRSGAGKWMVPIDRLIKRARTRSARLRGLIFPHYRPGSGFKVRRMPYGRYMDRLRRDPNGYLMFGLSDPGVLLDQILFYRLIHKSFPVYECEYSAKSFAELVDWIDRQF